MNTGDEYNNITSAESIKMCLLSCGNYFQPAANPSQWGILCLHHYMLIEHQPGLWSRNPVSLHDSLLISHQHRLSSGNDVNSHGSLLMVHPPAWPLVRESCNITWFPSDNPLAGLASVHGILKVHIASLLVLHKHNLLKPHQNVHKQFY